MTLSIGIPGALSDETVRLVAPAVEAAGYRALWINDTPKGDALAKLAVAAEVTSTLGLAVGVVPLDRQGGAEIAARVRALPTERLRIGIGAGGVKQGSLALLERGVAELREGADVPVLIGALGPRARRLAATVADGILFNWLTPDAARDAMTQLQEDAAGRAVEGVLYVRTVAGPEARAALEKEVGRYASVPAYAANFERLGIDPLDTTVDLSRPGSAAAFYGVSDEIVRRLVTATDDPRELLRAVRTRAIGPDVPPGSAPFDGYFRDTRLPGRPRYWKLAGGQDFRLVDGAWVGVSKYKHGPSWWVLSGETCIDKVAFDDLPPGTPA